MIAQFQHRQFKVRNGKARPVMQFTQRMLESQQDSMIVQTIIDLSHNLGLKVVAEGIDDPKVGIVAATEKVNPKMSACVDAALITQMNRRGQITGAGLGRRLANSIRSQTYPKTGESLNAATLVWSKAPEIVGAHDAGPLIRSKDGFWLAIPLDAAGKSLRGGRITPGEWERRRGLRLRFVYRRRGPSLLVADGRLQPEFRNACGAEAGARIHPHCQRGDPAPGREDGRHPAEFFRRSGLQCVVHSPHPRRVLHGCNPGPGCGWLQRRSLRLPQYVRGRWLGGAGQPGGQPQPDHHGAVRIHHVAAAGKVIQCAEIPAKHQQVPVRD